jgi:hypothetical protein
MSSTVPAVEQMGHHESLNVKVRYAAVAKPYEDPSAESTESLAILKHRVLDHFGLVEGDVDGGRKEYVLTYQGEQQTDLSVTLGKLAEGKHHLEMNLIEHFIQG